MLRDGLGHVTRVAARARSVRAAAAGLANAIQRHLVEQTRLGIPAIVHEEICSGVMARDATVFPQAIGLASTWEPELAEELADAVRAQMRARGRPPGPLARCSTSAATRAGAAPRRRSARTRTSWRVWASRSCADCRAPTSRDGVIATAKHFVGYGASEGGINWAPAHLPPRELREVYLHPFEAAVRSGGLRSMMNAYNELDGIPCGAPTGHCSRRSCARSGASTAASWPDYFSIRQLADYHRLAADAAQAAAMALNAGLDVELPGTDCYGAPLVARCSGRPVAERTIDMAVRRVLRSKFELGLFERRTSTRTPPRAPAGAPAQRDLARRIARKSLVLLPTTARCRSARSMPAPWR